MSRKRRRRRRPPTIHRRPSGHEGQPTDDAFEDLDIVRDVRRALRESHPLDLLAIASSLVAALDPRSLSPMERARGDEPDGPSLRELAGSFIEVRTIETTALLTVIAELTDDELLATMIRRELAAREHRLPRWLRYLTPIRVERAVEMSHVLGDGENVLLGATTGADDHFTAVVYVDHNLGTLVKDAFVVDDDLDTIVGRFRDASEGDPDTTFRDLDLADARARVDEVIETASITYPPFETETWPACRPVVEWVTRQLPEGGTGYVRPEWTEDDREQLAERFFTSPFGQPLDDEDHRDLIDTILWFGCDYGRGDPLRWSPVSVELILADWLPRKVMAPADFLAKAPDLLRAFIRFAHDESGIRETLTKETLEAVDYWESEYQETIRSPRPQGPLALLDAMGVLDEDDDEWFLDPDGFGSPDEAMLSRLRAEVGGAEALRALDAAPLPDESFDWSAVPDDVHDRVAEVVDLVDRCCIDLYDVEHRTACWRLLADVVAEDPGIFRRGRPETAAFATIWIIGKANDSFTSYRGGPLVKDLAAWLGVSGSPTQRAETMLRAIGRLDASAYDMVLGDPRYLVSAYRFVLVSARDALSGA